MRNGADTDGGAARPELVAMAVSILFALIALHGQAVRAANQAPELSISPQASEPRKGNDAIAEKSGDSAAVESTLDLAVTRLLMTPAPQGIRQTRTQIPVEVPDPMRVRRAMRMGDLSLLKAYLPDINRYFEAGQVSEQVYGKALIALDAPLSEALPALDVWVAASPKEYSARLARGIVRIRTAAPALPENTCSMCS